MTAPFYHYSLFLLLFFAIVLPINAQVQELPRLNTLLFSPSDIPDAHYFTAYYYLKEYKQVQAVIQTDLQEIKAQQDSISGLKKPNKLRFKIAKVEMKKWRDSLRVEQNIVNNYINLWESQLFVWQLNSEEFMEAFQTEQCYYVYTAKDEQFTPDAYEIKPLTDLKTISWREYLPPNWKVKRELIKRGTGKWVKRKKGPLCISEDPEDCYVMCWVETAAIIDTVEQTMVCPTGFETDESIEQCVRTKSITPQYFADQLEIMHWVFVKKDTDNIIVIDDFEKTNCEEW